MGSPLYESLAVPEFWPLREQASRTGTSILVFSPTEIGAVNVSGIVCSFALTLLTVPEPTREPFK